MDENPVNPKPENEQPSGDTGKPIEADKPSVVSMSVGKVDPERNNPASLADQVKQKREPLSRMEIWTIVLAIIGILVAAGTGIAIIWQDIIASETLRELQRQYPELKKSANAAQSAATIAKDALQSSDASASSTIAEMQKQSKAMQDNVRDYEDATRKELQPYVFLQRMDLAEPILPYRLTPTLNSFINSGNTPAFNLQHLIRSDSVVDGSGPKFTFMVITGSKGAIAPKGTFDGDINIVQMTPTQVAQVYAGTRIVYVTGRITYTDVFKKTHQLEYCMMLTPKDGKMIACREQGKSY